MKYPVYLYIAVMAIVTSDLYAAIDTDQERDQKSFYPLFFILCALCYPVCNDLPGHYLRNCFSCFRSCRFGSGTVFRLYRKEPVPGFHCSLCHRVYPGVFRII